MLKRVVLKSYLTFSQHFFPSTIISCWSTLCFSNASHPENLVKISTFNIDGCEVTTFNGKVWVPKELQQRIVEWYHSNLQHAGVKQTINSIGQTFAWKDLSMMVKKHVSTCDSCQCNKQTNKQAFGKFPLTSALCDKNPWEVVRIDCCGTWKIKFSGGMTMNPEK